MQKVWMERRNSMSVRTCKTCGLPIDLCACKEEAIEKAREQTRKIIKNGDIQLLTKEEHSRLHRIGIPKGAILKLNVIDLIDKRIAELQPIWKKHLKGEGGSCYCMSSDESCIPEAIEELRKLKKEIKKLE
jgi:hypothetical protein